MMVSTWTMTRAQSNSLFSAAEERHEKFNDMLEAMRSFDREARSGSPNYASMQDSAMNLELLVRAIPSWFPAGSGSESGARTNARPEIWRNWNDFRLKATASQSAAQTLAAAVRSANPEAIDTAERALRATCRSCHQTYEYEGF